MEEASSCAPPRWRSAQAGSKPPHPERTQQRSRGGHPPLAGEEGEIPGHMVGRAFRGIVREETHMWGLDMTKEGGAPGHSETENMHEASKYATTFVNMLS